MIRAYRPERPRVTLADAVAVLRAMPAGIMLVAAFAVWAVLAWSVAG